MTDKKSDAKAEPEKAVEPDVEDELAVRNAQKRLADADKAAAVALAKDDAGNPLAGPVDIGKDDRGLDRDVRVDPADNKMRTFVSNNTGKPVEG